MSSSWPYFDEGLLPGRPGYAGESNDDRLARQVAQQLLLDPLTRRQHITVSAQNRVVILLGSVDSALALEAATEYAWSATDVFDVCNALVLTRRRRRYRAERSDAADRSNATDRTNATDRWSDGADKDPAVPDDDPC